MTKTRILLSLSALTLSVAGGFVTTFAKTFATKAEMVQVDTHYTNVGGCTVTSKTPPAGCTTTASGTICSTWFSSKTAAGACANPMRIRP